MTWGIYRKSLNDENAWKSSDLEGYYKEFLRNHDYLCKVDEHLHTQASAPF